MSGEPGCRLFRRVDEPIAASARARNHLEQIVVVILPADAETIQRHALGAVGHDLLLQILRFHVAEVGRAIGQQHNAIFAVGQVMAEGRLIGQPHRLLQIGAAFGRERLQGVHQRGKLAARHAVGPQPRRAREHHHAHPVLRLQLRRQHAQRLANDGHAVGPFHRAGLVKQQNEVERPSRLPSLRGGLHRKPQQIAIGRERITGAFRRETERGAGRGFRVAIIKGVDELLAPHRGRIRQGPVLQRSRRQLEGNIADVEREGGKGVVARLNLRLRGRGENGWLARSGFVVLDVSLGSSWNAAHDHAGHQGLGFRLLHKRPLHHRFLIYGRRAACFGKLRCRRSFGSAGEKIAAEGSVGEDGNAYRIARSIRPGHNKSVPAVGKCVAFWQWQRRGKRKANVGSGDRLRLRHKCHFR